MWWQKGILEPFDWGEHFVDVVIDDYQEKSLQIDKLIDTTQTNTSDPHGDVEEERGREGRKGTRVRVGSL